MMYIVMFFSGTIVFMLGYTLGFGLGCRKGYALRVIDNVMQDMKDIKTGKDHRGVKCWKCGNESFDNDAYCIGCGEFQAY